MMNFENILSALITFLCALVMGGISLWAFKRKTPMNFWAGDEIKPETITNVTAYNKANGIMWAIYAAFMVVSSIISLFNVMIGAILLTILCVPGVIVLIIAYKRIQKKYSNPMK